MRTLHDRMDEIVPIRELFICAQTLLDPIGEVGETNPEYARAMVELITDVAGMSMEEKVEVARELGFTSFEFLK